MPDDERKWNVPSAIAFVGALLVGAGMLVAASVHKDSALGAQGATVLLVALGIAAPQPMVGDK